jgi:hypothetical protein
MTIKAQLADFERQHKALEHEIAEALGQSSVDDLKITELKRRKLTLKDQIERLRHDCIMRTRAAAHARRSGEREWRT